MNSLTSAVIKELFQARFTLLPEVVVSAPGRVNLIGEHTDYNDGFVLPAAINYRTWVAATPRDDRELHIIAHDFTDQFVSFHLDEEMQHDAAMPWSNYVRGVVQQLRRNHFELRGGNLFITGDVPAGAGLSSSASLEMALIRALTILSGESIEPKAAALMGQAAENQFVGCNCGIMDQLISACGEANSALLIDCRDLSTQPVAIPQDWEILVVHSGVKRGLVESEYNQRREQCEAVARHFHQKSLRDISLEQLLAAEAELDPLLFKRARHVLTENNRTLAAADALKKGDMARLSRVMMESHASMRDDFNITVPAVDTLVDILTTAGKGLAGARMTGGGFGGCVVAIAPRAMISTLMAAVEDHYQQETGCKPTLIPAKASPGAFAEFARGELI
ncbi:MAG: galactokinase [Cellvibrio sp.]